VSFLRPISSLERGDHACLIYDDPARRDDVLLTFLESGLATGDRVVYLADDADGRIVEQLTLLARPEQFAAIGSRETFLVDGAFDAERVLTSFRTVRDDSLAAGFHGVRAAGEPPESLRRNGCSRSLTEYERRANQLFESGDMAAICAYDTRTTNAEALVGLIEAHPVVLFAVGANPRLRIEAAETGAIELRGWLDLTTLGSLVGPLSAAVTSFDDVVVDLAEVDFIDVAGLRLFVEAADLLHRRDGKLTLRSTPAWIGRVLDVLGYGNREGLILQ